MFLVLLKFSQNKSKAGDFMEGHNHWIKNGFDEGVFYLAGSLKPGLGGALIAHGISREALEARVNEDPFVREQVVESSIIEIAPSKASKELEFFLV